MNEQWQELKETITEMRDSCGTLTQQEVCKFLLSYMKILEKQMQEPVLDKIRAEIEALEEGITSYHNDRPWIFNDEVLQIIDKYRKGEEE